MSKTNPLQFNWRNTLGALAIAIAPFVDVPAIAAPMKDSFEIAQVGIRSNIQPPVPLNLRPRVIVTPSSHHRPHYRHHGYPRHYPHYNRHRRHYPHPHYKHRSHHRRRHGHHKKIIIISPGGSHHRYDRGHYNRHGSHHRGGAYIRIGY